MNFTMFDPTCKYAIINKQWDTVLDFSGSDFKSAIGYQWHGGDNQQVRL
jgi:hypothetical protein